MVLRDNHVRNNGGVFVGGSAADIVVEGCTVANSTCANGTNPAVEQVERCFAVDRTHATGVVLRGNRYV